MMRWIWASAASAIALGCMCGCDDRVEQVNQGQSAVNQARSVAGTDLDQKIDLAVTLLNTGRVTDAENLLNQVSANESSLSETSKAKLANARQQLEQAKAGK